ncbi:MAG: quinol oxidase [Nitrospiraceae bacterium]|nr:quinol oxidase [Nitrospiraceae bacterium]MSR24979.1 quinol oxidase [Nitrospiraceae bacterium]
MQSTRSAMALFLFGVLLAPVSLPADEPPPAAAPPVTAEVGADGVQRATIILDSYSYTPGHLIVQSGKPVELTLTSVTTIVPHNFILKDPAMGLNVEKDMSAGKTDKVTFTPTQAGTVTFYCDRRLWPMPSHRDKGMEGKLEVR